MTNIRKIFVAAISTLFVFAFFVGQAAIAETPFDKGVALYRKKQYDEAIAMFRSAAERGINQPDSVYYMAMCYQQLGNLKDAHDSYKFICTRFPNAAVASKSFMMMRQIGLRLEEMKESSGAPADTRPLTMPGEPVAEKSTPTPSRSTAPEAGAYVVRFTDEAMDGRMYIDGTIDGKKCKILFDTGAGVTFCRQSFLDKQNWKLNWIKEVAIIPGALRESPAKVSVVKISIGQLAREEKIYVEQDPPDSLYASYDNCPIIGQSFFGDLSYEIDGTRGTITFRKPSSIRPKNAPPVKPTAKEVPFTREGSHIVVKAKINNRECDMYFDTGASQVVFADRHLAQCGLNRPVEATNTVRRSAGSRRDSYAFTIGNIKFGPIEKAEVNAAVLLDSKFAKPLLGQSFLQGLKYTVDPVRNVIRFE